MMQSVEWLSAGAHRMLAAYGVCVFFAVFALLLAVPQRTRRIRYLAGPLLASLISVTFMIVWDLEFSRPFLSYARMPGFVQVLAGLPVWVGVLLDLCSLGGACLSEVLLRRHRRESITRASVRESVDNLPAGLCFALEGGLPLMVNRTMEDLCQRITGDGLLNADRFWASLRGQKTADVPEIEAADALSVKMNDGRIWVFSRKKITVDGGPVVQFMATDATDLYALGRRLEEDNRALTDMNRRLSQYGENVTELTRGEEILETKMQIHDTLGEILMASRVALASAEERDPAFIRELFGKWKQSVALLRHEAVPEASDGADPVRQIEEAAEAAGVKVVFRGRFPREDRSATRLLFTATREALTNAVRHAGADTLTVGIQEIKGFWRVVFENDGSLPAGEIVEGGGLSGLRKRVEDAGGTMTVRADPAFSLIITAPKRIGADGPNPNEERT